MSFKNNVNFGVLLNNIGDAYYQLKNYSKALEFYYQVKPIFEQ